MLRKFSRYLCPGEIAKTVHTSVTNDLNRDLAANSGRHSVTEYRWPRLHEMFIFDVECSAQIIHAGLTATLHADNMHDTKLRVDLQGESLQSCTCCRKTKQVVFLKSFRGVLFVC